MSKQINIINLSLEQIEDIRSQLKVFDEEQQRPKTIMDKVKSWEDALEELKNKPLYYVDNISEFKVAGTRVVSNDKNKNCVPSEIYTKAILATSQLMVIAEVLNEGWKPNWEDWVEPKFAVYFNKKRLDVAEWHGNKHTLIYFKSKKLAKYAISQFEDLWYDHYMVDNPNK